MQGFWPAFFRPTQMIVAWVKGKIISIKNGSINLKNPISIYQAFRGYTKRSCRLQQKQYLRCAENHVVWEGVFRVLGHQLRRLLVKVVFDGYNHTSKRPCKNVHQNISSRKTGFIFEIVECRLFNDLPQARNAICRGDSNWPNALIDPFRLATKAPIAMAIWLSRLWLPITVTISAFAAANPVVKWHCWRKVAKWSRYRVSSCFRTCIGIEKDKECPEAWTNFSFVCSNSCGRHVFFVRTHLAQGWPPSH